MALFHLPSFTKVTVTDRLTAPWIQLFTNLFNLLNQGYPPAVNNANGQASAATVVVPLTKLTGGGTDGSLTITNGIITGVVDPT